MRKESPDIFLEEVENQKQLMCNDTSCDGVAGKVYIDFHDEFKGFCLKFQQGIFSVPFYATANELRAIADKIDEFNEV